MQPDEFVQSRKEDWQQLSQLLDRSRNGLNHMSPADIERLGQLYRAATSDLALAQRDFPQHRVVLYLNQLVGRGHAVVYRSKPMVWQHLWHFITRGYPQLFFETLPFTLVAALLFFGPLIVTGIATLVEPDLAQWLMPEGMQELVPQIENQDLWIDIPVHERPYASSFIMTNNIRVAFMAFGGGMLAGLFTLYILIFNGLIIGSIVGLTIHYGVGLEMLSFMVGHGVLELSVICLAGGSGLMMGWAILQPGLLSRRDALAVAGRKAIQLLMGSIPLLVVAGLIEGFISPAAIVPWPLKWVVGLFTGVVFYSYVFLMRTTSEAESTI